MLSSGNFTPRPGSRRAQDAELSKVLDLQNEYREIEASKPNKYNRLGIADAVTEKMADAQTGLFVAEAETLS